MIEKKVIYLARSMENGIEFYSNYLPDHCATAIRETSGKIKCYWNVNTELYEAEEKFDVTDILICFIIVITAIFTLNSRMATASMIFLIFGGQHVIYFIRSVIRIRLKRKRLTRYHGAEHMSTAAYMDLNRIPTIQEVKKYSRFSEYCGSMYFINKVVKPICLSVVTLFFSYDMSIIIRILIYLPILLLIDHIQKRGWFKYLQVLFIDKPPDQEIEVAIEGIKEYEKMEDSIKRNYKGAIFIGFIN